MNETIQKEITSKLTPLVKKWKKAGFSEEEIEEAAFTAYFILSPNLERMRIVGPPQPEADDDRTPEPPQAA